MMKGEAESSMAEKKSSKKFLILGLLAVAVIAVISVVVVMTVKKKESYRTLEIIECVGEGTVYRGEKEIAAYEDMKLRSGDTITVGENSYVRMKFDDDKYVYLEGHALIKLVADGTKKDSRTIVDIELGTMITEVQNKLSDKSVYEINSPNTTMAIRGTITVSKVEYEIPEITDAAGETIQIQKKDVFEYIIKKNKLGKYSEKNTANKPGESDGTVQSPEDELLEETLAKVEEVFNSGVKAAVSSFVHEGKVELTTYEKKVQEDGTALLAAVKVPVEEGNGINTKVEEIIPAAVVSEIKADDNGKLTINRTETVEEFLQDVVESVIEVQQVETIEELKEVLTEKIVETIEKVEELNLSINLNQGSISEVIQETQPAWNETITPMPTEAAVATEAPMPTEVPVATEAPTPTEVLVATEAPTPTEVPVATEAPTPTEVPVATETPTPTSTPSPIPSPTTIPTSIPTSTPSPTPTSRPTLTATPSPTPSPEPTNTPTPSPEPTNTPTPSPEPTNTPTPSPEPTSTPAPSPEPTSTPAPSPELTSTPAPSPELTSTPAPSPEPTSTPATSPEPTATPELTQFPDIGFECVVETDENGAEYVVLKSYSASDTGVIIPSIVTVETSDGSKEIPVVEIAEDAFADRTDLNLIQADVPMNGLAVAINNAANNNTLSSLTVPVTVVSSLSANIMANLKVLSVVPVEGFVMGTDTKVLFPIEQCTALQTLSLPVDLINYVQLTNEIPNYLELIVVPGCDGSVVMPSGALVSNMKVRLLSMEGVSLPVGGYVLPSMMKALTVKNVESIPDNPLGETTDNNNLYHLTLENVKSIGAYAFANCRNLTTISSDGLEEIAATAFHNSNTKIIANDQLRYREENGSIVIEEVSILQDNYISRVTLPERIAGKYVSVIDTGAFTQSGQNGIAVDIILPSTVYKIASGAFEGSLVGIVEAPGVKTIEAGAFKNCTRLTRVETRNLTSVDATAFDGCDKLQGVPAILDWFEYTTEANGIVINGFSESYPGHKKIAIPVWFGNTLVTKIADNAFAGDTIIEQLLVSGSTAIGKSAFENCDKLSNVVLLVSNSVGERAFYDCDSLQFLQMDRTPSIGASAAENCDLLSSVSMSLAREIGSRAFAECINLRSVSMQALETIGSYAFYNCASLEISLPDLVTFIDSQALVGIANKRIYIPKNAEVVAGAISQEVTILADSGALITQNADYTCEELPYPGRILSSIGEMYAYGDERVKPEVVGDTPTMRFQLSQPFGNKQYYYRIQTTSLSAAESAFLQKEQLQSSMPEEWMELPYASVIDLPISDQYYTTVYIKSVDLSTGETLYYYSRMITTYNPANDVSTFVDGNMIYQIYGEQLGSPYAVLTEYTGNEELVAVPANVGTAKVTKIGESAFAGNTTVKWVELNENCIKIGAHAFEGCSALESIFMPEVQEIGNFAFCDCSALKETGMMDLVSVGEGAFNGCTSLYVSLPDTVEYIGSDAFVGIKNTRLYIPSQAEVAENAFTFDGELYAASDAKIRVNETLSISIEVYDSLRIRTYQSGDLFVYDGKAMEQIDLSEQCADFVFPQVGGRFYVYSERYTSIPEDYMSEFSPELIEGWTEIDSIGYGINLEAEKYDVVWFKYIDVAGNVSYFCSEWLHASSVFEYEEIMIGDMPSYKITGYIGKPMRDVEVPEFIGELPVSTIGAGAFDGLEAVDTVVVAVNRCNVETLAFSQCQNLVSVRFINGVGRIEGGAFSNCINLTTVACGDGYDSKSEQADSIDFSACMDCPNLESQPLGTEQLIYEMVESENGENSGVMIFGLQMPEAGMVPSRIYIPAMINGVEVREIGSNAFSYPDSGVYLERVYLAETITTIGEGAFANQSSLQFVDMPGVTKIGDNAFSGCSNLTPLIRDSLQEIGSGAFADIDANKVTSIFVPKNTIVAMDAFGSYSGTIYTPQDSMFAKAVSGSTFTIVYKDDPLRMITLPGGTTYADNYNGGITGDCYGLGMKVYLEGVSEVATTSGILVNVNNGQTSLDSSNFDQYEYSYHNVREFSITRWNDSRILVLLFKIESPNEETRYIVTNRWLAKKEY